MGTPRYMAPELVGEARLARAPCDVFSFGVIAYELLTRALPFPEPAALLCLKNERIPPPTPLAFAGDAHLRDLAACIERCVAVEPADRPGAAELRDLLARAVDRDRAVAAG